MICMISAFVEIGKGRGGAVISCRKLVGDRFTLLQIHVYFGDVMNMRSHWNTSVCGGGGGGERGISRSEGKQFRQGKRNSLGKKV